MSSTPNMWSMKEMLRNWRSRYQMGPRGWLWCRQLEMSLWPRRSNNNISNIKVLAEEHIVFWAINLKTNSLSWKDEGHRRWEVQCVVIGLMDIEAEVLRHRKRGLVECCQLMRDQNGGIRRSERREDWWQWRSQPNKLIMWSHRKRSSLVKQTRRQRMR